MKNSGISRREFLGAAGAAATLAVVPVPLRAAAGQSAKTISEISSIRIASSATPILFDPDDLAFMSFEHYPYPPCDIVWADLFREPELISHILDVWRQDGLPANVPMMNTESNVTYGNAEEMIDIFFAL